MIGKNEPIFKWLYNNTGFVLYDSYGPDNLVVTKYHQNRIRIVMSKGNRINKLICCVHSYGFLRNGQR